MIQAGGEPINYKRVERLYQLDKLHIRRRRPKKIPVSERQPLMRPGKANEIWSMDFVFDRIASGRTLKCLTIVDDATHEAVAVTPEHTIGGDHLTRIMDEICSRRGRPAMIRSDNVLSSKASPIADEQYPGSRRQWHREAKTSSVSIKPSSLPQRSRSR